MMRDNRQFFLGKRSVVFFFASIACVFAGHGLQLTLFPLLARARGLPLEELSHIMLLQSLSFLAGALIAPRLVKKIGYGPSFLFCLALLGVATGTLVDAHTPLVLLLDRMAVGFSTALIYANLDSWINEVSENRIRARAMGVYFIFNFGFMMLGSSFLNLGTVGGWALPALATAWIGLSACLFLGLEFIPSVTRLTPTSEEPRSFYIFKSTFGEAVLGAFSISPLGVLGMFAMGMATAPFWDFGPLFAQSVSPHAPLNVASFMVITVIGGVAGQYPLGTLSDLFGRKCIIFLGAFSGACASLFITCLPLSSLAGPKLYYLAGFLYGLCTFHLYALSAACIFDYVHNRKGSFIELSSWYLILYAAGSATGNLLISGLMFHFPSARIIFIPSILANFAVCLLYMGERFARKSSLQEI